MTNTLLFKSAMVKKGYTGGTLADAVGISRQSMSYKMNNKRDFTVSEIANISNVLELSMAERDAIFFGNEVE